MTAERFKRRSYGLRWRMDGATRRYATSPKTERVYKIKKVRPDVIFQYEMYQLSARSPHGTDMEEIGLYMRLRDAQDAADRCEWARWEA